MPWMSNRFFDQPRPFIKPSRNLWNVRPASAALGDIALTQGKGFEAVEQALHSLAKSPARIEQACSLSEAVAVPQCLWDRVKDGILPDGLSAGPIQPASCS